MVGRDPRVMGIAISEPFLNTPTMISSPGAVFNARYPIRSSIDFMGIELIDTITSPSKFKEPVRLESPRIPAKSAGPPGAERLHMHRGCHVEDLPFHAARYLLHSR